MNQTAKTILVPSEFLPIRNHLAWLGMLGVVLFAVRAFLVVKADPIPPLSIFGSPPVPVSATYAPWIILAGLLAWAAAGALGGARSSEVGAVPPCGWSIVPFRLFQFFGVAGLVSAFLVSDPRFAIEPAISLVQSLFVFFLPKLFQSFLLLAAGTAGVALLRLWKRNEALLPAGSLRSARQAGWNAAFFAGFTALTSAPTIQGAVRAGLSSVQAVVFTLFALFQFAVFVFLAVLCFRFRRASEPARAEAGSEVGRAPLGQSPAP